MRRAPFAAGKAVTFYEATKAYRKKVTVKIDEPLRERRIFMAVIQVTEDNFDEVVMKSKKPVLLDFYADWCGPCKMMSPIVEEISEEYADTYVVGKVNVDEEPALALKYQVMSIPMLVTMNYGAFSEKSIGAVDKETVLALLERAGQVK